MCSFFKLCKLDQFVSFAFYLCCLCIYIYLYLYFLLCLDVFFSLLLLTEDHEIIYCFYLRVKYDL